MRSEISGKISCRYVGCHRGTLDVISRMSSHCCHMYVCLFAGLVCLFVLLGLVCMVCFVLFCFVCLFVLFVRFVCLFVCLRLVFLKGSSPFFVFVLPQVNKEVKQVDLLFPGITRWAWGWDCWWHQLWGQRQKDEHEDHAHSLLPIHASRQMTESLFHGSSCNIFASYHLHFAFHEEYTKKNPL
jgi:hypothetical protein